MTVPTSDRLTILRRHRLIFWIQKIWDYRRCIAGGTFAFISLTSIPIQRLISDRKEKKVPTPFLLEIRKVTEPRSDEVLRFPSFFFVALSIFTLISRRSKCGTFTAFSPFPHSRDLTLLVILQSHRFLPAPARGSKEILEDLNNPCVGRQWSFKEDGCSGFVHYPQSNDLCGFCHHVNPGVPLRDH